MSIGPICSSMRARVVELLGERDVLPAEARLAHVDGDVRQGELTITSRKPAAVSNFRFLAPVSCAHDPADAAHAVAAGFGQRAVGIVDAHEGFRARRTRGVQHHQLVEMGALGSAAMARASAVGENLGRARAGPRRRSRCRGRSSCGSACWQVRSCVLIWRAGVERQSACGTVIAGIARHAQGLRCCGAIAFSHDPAGAGRADEGARRAADASRCRASPRGSSTPGGCNSCPTGGCW